MGLELLYGEGQTPLDEDEKEGLKIKTITTQGELDEFVNETLLQNGWQVIRFWGEEIKKNIDLCVLKVEQAIEGR